MSKRVQPGRPIGWRDCVASRSRHNSGRIDRRSREAAQERSPRRKPRVRKWRHTSPEGGERRVATRSPNFS